MVGVLAQKWIKDEKNKKKQKAVSTSDAKKDTNEAIIEKDSKTSEVIYKFAEPING